MEDIRKDLLEYVIAIATGEGLAFGVGIGSVGFSSIRATILYSNGIDFSILCLKTLILAFIGGIGGLLAKYLWSLIKQKIKK